MKNFDCIKAILLLCVYLPYSHQVMYNLQPNEEKCLREEIHKNVLVSGEYEVQETQGQTVEIQVKY